MTRAMTALIAALLCAMVAAGCKQKQSRGNGAGTIRIGFLVKQPEEPWFQNEWKFAQQAADKDGFELIKIGATDGAKVLSAIDSLAAQDAQGFVICTPDVRLGPAIVARANRYHMKVFSVDDQLVGPDGKFMDVPHMGISARQIGRTVGKGLWDEMQRRGWKIEETAGCVPTRDELDTARERTDGAIEALVAAGFPADKVYKAPQKTTDIPGGRDAANIVLTQHPDVKHWLIAGMNDEAVLGAVRATENRGFSAADVIGIGIGGDSGKVDFEKPQPTGFFATVLISPRRHGYETADEMYHWIKDGVEPPKVTLSSGILVTRDNYRQVMKEQGLAS